MCAKVLRGLPLFGFCIALTVGNASVAQQLMDAPLVPTLDAIDAASSIDQHTHCVSSKCAATEALSRSLNALLDAQATTNGVPRPLSSDQGHLAMSALGQALLNHPTLYAPFCNLSRELASRYGIPGTPGDLFVAVSLIRLAAAIDGNKQEQCLPQLLASLPHNEASNTAITNARTLCENNPDHPRNCTRLTR